MVTFARMSPHTIISIMDKGFAVRGTTTLLSRRLSVHATVQHRKIERSDAPIMIMLRNVYICFGMIRNEIGLRNIFVSTIFNHDKKI